MYKKPLAQLNIARLSARERKTKTTASSRANTSLAQPPQSHQTVEITRAIYTKRTTNRTAHPTTTTRDVYGTRLFARHGVSRSCARARSLSNAARVARNDWRTSRLARAHRRCCCWGGGAPPLQRCASIDQNSFNRAANRLCACVCLFTLLCFRARVRARRYETTRCSCVSSRTKQFSSVRRRRHRRRRTTTPTFAALSNARSNEEIAHFTTSRASVFVLCMC